MSSMEIDAYNQTTNNWNLLTFVGGIGLSGYPPAAIMSLAWNVASFPAATGSGPGTTKQSWTQNYGFTALNSSTAGVVTWSAASFVAAPALGLQVGVSHDPITGNYNLSSPQPGGASGTLTFITNASIPPSPPTTVTLGVTINGTPVAAIPPNYVGPNLSYVFTINPTYTIATVANVVKGQVVSASVIGNPYVVSFAGGSTLQSATLGINNFWTGGAPALLTPASIASTGIQGFDNGLSGIQILISPSGFIKVLIGAGAQLSLGSAPSRVEAIEEAVEASVSKNKYRELQA